MAKAYTPGLLVTRHKKHRCVRRLPIAGEVKVAVGDTVVADDIVAETSLPGDVNPINLSNMMSLPPKDVIDCMLKKEGDPIAKDEPLAQSKGMFGLFKTIAHCRYEGTVETVSPVTGQVIIRGAPLPVQVRAYVGGDVVAVRASTRAARLKPMSPTCRASSVSAARHMGASKWPVRRTIRR